MNLKPIEQKNLYELNEYLHELINLNEKNKLPNKLIFSGQKGIGKSTLAYHLTNYLLSTNEANSYDIVNFKINESNRSFNLIKNLTHPNFFLVSLKESKKNIEISQIREMISFCNKSSFDDQYRVVFIDNIETLNTNSVNAILKVIEEPNEKILFFLIFDSSKNLLNTLSSRCINFNITLKKKQKEKVLNKLLDSNFLEDLNNDFKDYFLSPGDYINLYNYFNDNKISFSTTIEEFFKILFTRKDYKNSLFLKNNLSLFIELYFKKKFINFNSKIEAFSDYKYFLNLLSSANKYNLDLESVIMEFELKLKNG